MTQPLTRPAPRKPPEALVKAWGFVKRRKVLVAVVAWGVLLGVLAFVSPSVTVPEQTTVADSLGRLDEAMGDASGTLAGSDHGYYMLSSSDECDITPLRGGERYERRVVVHAQDPGAAITELADALTERYRLELVTGPDSPPRYVGRIPGYVTLTLALRLDNSIEWKADTGCRRPGDAFGWLRPPFETPREVTQTMEQIGVEDAAVSLDGASCGGGRSGQVRSVVATAGVPHGVVDLSSLSETVPERARVVVAEERVLVYRIGDSVTSVFMSDEEIVAATTVDCG
ncbi:MAG TPA: hypothetical protein H9881_09410 [Candidatus Stackebrandtia excrementipullorum]|nr:hypothetical protein [Candidatus Stackebrandtia excrementipullorum]